MSQNLDATAINQIHALISAQGVNEIISKIGADAVALPENFRIHDLEKFNLNRFRFRGALSTASIDDFTRYSKDLADEGTRCFIDADNMRAVSVLNLGTIDEPGHADNTATLKLKRQHRSLHYCLLTASVTPRSHWQNGLKTGPTTLWVLMLMVTPFRQPKRRRLSVKSQLKRTRPLILKIMTSAANAP